MNKYFPNALADLIHKTLVPPLFSNSLGKYFPEVLASIISDSLGYPEAKMYVLPKGVTNELLMSLGFTEEQAEDFAVIHLEARYYRKDVSGDDISGDDTDTDNEDDQIGKLISKLGSDLSSGTINLRKLLTELSLKSYPRMRRGDIVELYPDAYRNDAMLIYNGEILEVLSSDIDDYGQVPRTYLALTEFPPNYWLGAVTHNSYVPVDFTTIAPNPNRLVQELLKNVEVKSIGVFDGSDSETQLLVTHFHLYDRKFYILANPDRSDDLHSSEIKTFISSLINTVKGKQPKYFMADGGGAIDVDDEWLGQVLVQTE